MENKKFVEVNDELLMSLGGSYLNPPAMVLERAEKQKVFALLALDYYSSQETARLSGDAIVYWQPHGAQSGGNRLRLRWHQLLTRAARRLSHIAHRAHPKKEPGEVIALSP